VNNIEIGILTPASLASREEARSYLEALLEAVPEWTPTHYNSFEPVNRPFEPANLDAALDAWNFNFLFRRRAKPKISGSVWCGGINCHATSHISINKKGFELEAALRFIRALQQRFPVDLAYFYVFDPDAYPDNARYNAESHPFRIGITNQHLKEVGLPSVPWAMLFGPHYITRIGRDHLLRTPAARVEEMAGGVYVQLTHTVAEVSANRDAYLAAQQAVRDHVNSHFTGTPAPFQVHHWEQQGHETIH
jgi:hypothetical protein